MKNIKAFTLSELLAVIAILGILLLIAVPSVTGIQKSSEKKQLKNDEETFKSIIKSKIMKDTTIDIPSDTAICYTLKSINKNMLNGEYDENKSYVAVSDCGYSNDVYSCGTYDVTLVKPGSKGEDICENDSSCSKNRNEEVFKSLVKEQVKDKTLDIPNDKVGYFVLKSVDTGKLTNNYDEKKSYVEVSDCDYSNNVYSCGKYDVALIETLTIDEDICGESSSCLKDKNEETFKSMVKDKIKTHIIDIPNNKVGYFALKSVDTGKLTNNYDEKKSYVEVSDCGYSNGVYGCGTYDVTLVKPGSEGEDICGESSSCLKDKNEIIFKSMVKEKLKEKNFNITSGKTGYFTLRSVDTNKKLPDNYDIHRSYVAVSNCNCSNDGCNCKTYTVKLYENGGYETIHCPRTPFYCIK